MQRKWPMAKETVAPKRDELSCGMELSALSSLDRAIRKQKSLSERTATF